VSFGYKFSSKNHPYIAHRVFKGIANGPVKKGVYSQDFYVLYLFGWLG